jgi:ATP-dependent Clp protease ATP-binding subunit ClpC
MYERFTERARNVLRLAKQEAQRFEHNYIGTEHILLGLIKEGTGVAVSVLRNLDIDLRKIQIEVEKAIPSGLDLFVMGRFSQTPRAKKVIEHCIEEARNFGHNHVGTEHLLLGLIREQGGLAGQILIHLGVKLEDVREGVRNLPGHNPAAEASGNAGSDRPAGVRESLTPVLESFGRDLTELASQGKLAPLIGRAREIEQVIEILGRRTKSNPMLLGEPGVGKTAIVEGLAQRIAGGLVPEFLRTHRIVALDLATLAGGATCSGQFEGRIKAVLHEARLAKNVILFVDEFHTLVGAVSPEGVVDVSPLLVPVLARKEIPFIGGSTFDDYRKYIERDGALERRFQPVLVNPPSTEESLEIFKGFRDYCEAHHRVRITDEAVAAAVELSDLYLPERFFPQKAIGLMDEAAAAVRLRALGKPPDFKDLDFELAQVNRDKEASVGEGEFERAARLRDQADNLKRKRERLVQEWGEKLQQIDGVVGVQAVIETLSLQTGIPAGLIRERDTSMLRSRPQTGPDTPRGFEQS